MNQEPIKVDATLSEWEEQMVDELANKHNIDSDVVLDIGCTFLLNEVSGVMHGEVCILNTIHKTGMFV